MIAAAVVARGACIVASVWLATDTANAEEPSQGGKWEFAVPTPWPAGKPLSEGVRPRPDGRVKLINTACMASDNLLPIPAIRGTGMEPQVLPDIRPGVLKSRPLLLHHRIRLLTWPRAMSGMPQFFGKPTPGRFDAIIH